MAILLAILDLLFGCHHVHLSRVFTLQGETYRVCCDCGAKFAYSPLGSLSGVDCSHTSDLNHVD